MTKRRETATHGRSVVQVRDPGTGSRFRAEVCAGCWQNPARRRVLIRDFARRGLAVDHPSDDLDGRIRIRAAHVPGCPYGRPNKERGT